MKLLERDIERTCTDFLALDGWRCLKTDPVSRREWGKGFGEKGMADCLYIRYGSQMPEEVPIECRILHEVMWIEWKRPRNSATKEQQLWHTIERKRGALTLIAGIDFEASISGFEQWYRASGLMRRRID